MVSEKTQFVIFKNWGSEVFLKQLQPSKLKPKETVGHSFYHKTKGKVVVAKGGAFVEKVLSGRIINIDEVTESEKYVQSSAAS
jgi:hypothetical protein